MFVALGTPAGASLGPVHPVKSVQAGVAVALGPGFILGYRRSSADVFAPATAGPAPATCAESRLTRQGDRLGGAVPGLVGKREEAVAVPALPGEDVAWRSIRRQEVPRRCRR